ncbi:MAG: response regulator receiver protein [Chlamydiales bacterium]|jgi:ribonuclease BN (tRNA processing enzyme)|nr:response regulator receiver protein [Chlamydiales bacterium]
MDAPRKKILIIDDTSYVPEMAHQVLPSEKYTIISNNGTLSYFDLIKNEKPDLVIFEIMLAEAGGISILKTIKANPEFNKIGTIILTGRALIQDYYSAKDMGVDYYAAKPITKETLSDIVEHYFAGTLGEWSTLQPFHERQDVTNGSYYTPVLAPTAKCNYMKFWGTRGSTAVSGKAYSYYGGNTSCFEIVGSNKKERIIFDAGTGIRPLAGEILGSEVDTIHLFISHTHWDHIIGFPFFIPVYIPKYTIHVYSAPGFYKNLHAAFNGMLEYDYFPVKFDEMRANFHFHELSGAPVNIGDIKIDYIYAYHPGPTICFKIETPDKSFGYATDNEFLLGYHGHPNEIFEDSALLAYHMPMIDFYKGCDTLIHEAPFLPQEYRQKVGWGHSSISNASILAKYSGAKDWYVTHHDHEHDDNALNQKYELHKAILAECNIPCSLHMARDGLVLPF